MGAARPISDPCQSDRPQCCTNAPQTRDERLNLSKQLPDGAIGMGQHSPKNLKRFPWPVCSHCGLVYLKNDASRKRVKRGCIIWADEQGRVKL